MRAMSTPVGHSRRHALHPTHRSITPYIASDVNASGPSWPESASRSAVARPRVTSFSSWVAMYDGHMTPSALRQLPLLLHISTAPLKPPHALQSSTVVRSTGS